MIRKWFILGLLCIVVVILLRDLYKEVIAYNPLADIEFQVRENSAGTKQADAAVKTGWSREIIDNNLFGPSRTPIMPPPPKPPGPIKPIEIPKRPDMSLKGIILDQFGDYVAYIEKDKSRPVQVRQGDRLDDVDVIEIKQKSVELRWNDETIFLSLDKIKTIKKPR